MTSAEAAWAGPMKCPRSLLIGLWLPAVPRLRASAPALAVGALLAAAPSDSWGQGVLRWDQAVHELAGRCDASAAVAVPPGDLGGLVVANDERDVLEAYALGTGAAPTLAGGDLRGVLAVPGGGGEADLEGAARLGDRVYWTGSHGTNKSGERRPRREQVFATGLARQGAAIAVTPPAGAGEAYRGLRDDLARLPQLSGAIDRLLPPEQGGLNIEGLAAGADGTSLLLGLRSPLAPDGRRAMVVRFANPGEVAGPTAAPGRRAVLDPPIPLDLGGRGIRSMELVPATASAAASYRIVAGPPGEGDDFALFAWSGRADDAPRPVPGAGQVFADLRKLEHFRPEALVVADGGRTLVLLSDDGERIVSGEECKDLPASQQRFRTVVLSLQ